MDYKIGFEKMMNSIEEFNLIVKKELNEKKKILEKINVIGKLRITTSSKGKPMYYYLVPPDNKRVYIKKEKLEFARTLAEKEFLENSIIALRIQSDCIKVFLKNMSSKNLCEIYNKLNSKRKALLLNSELDDQQFIKEWMSKESQYHNSYEIKGEYYTMNNEHVRSKSEKIIADSLYMHGVPYKYEQALILDSGEIIFPDFSALNVKKRKVYYIEHLGMMHDLNYVSRNLQKIDKYQFNGIWPGDNLLITAEGGERTLNSKMVDNMIERFLL